MSERKFYLGKMGQIFGPYSQAEFDGLLNEGKLQAYTWFWDSAGSAEWQPIDPPPGAPEGRATSTTSRAIRANSKLQAICHDHLTLANGRLDRVTEVGCDFVTSCRSSSPQFATLTRITLDLLDPDSGRAMTLTARLVSVARFGGEWRYQLQWSQCPDICTAAA